MVSNERSEFSMRTQSRRYEDYEKRIQGVRKMFDYIRRHRIALTAVAIALTGLVFCFLGMIGHFTGEARCSDFYYGEQPQSSLRAFLTGVEYQYASADGEPVWSDQAPVVPGQYRIRAVSRNGFGVYRYSEEMTATMHPRELRIDIMDASYIYGDFDGELAADNTTVEGLRPEDTLADVEYGVEGTEAAGYHVTLASLRIVNEAGADVSAGYLLKTACGVFTMLPRPITISVGSYEKLYDGNVWDGAETKIIGGTLAFQDRLQAELDDMPVNAGIYALEPACQILDETGKDVSDRYSITLVTGVLEIKHREITVRTGSAEKLYDEKPLTNPDWSVVSADLAPGHQLAGHVTGSRTTVGESANEVKLTVQDASGTDVTANYQFTVEWGTLKVNPIVLKFQTDSGEKVYDGEAMRVTGCRLVSGSVLPGHTLSFATNVSAISAGVYKNGLQVKIYDANGQDVKADGYAIEVEYGTLTIHKRPITLTSESAEKLYDGTPLTKKEYTITAGTIPAAEIGDVIDTAHFTGSQTEVGSSSNTFSVLIRDKNGYNNYDITYIFGTLTVHENPNMPQGGGENGVQSSGNQTSTGIGRHGLDIQIGFPKGNEDILYATVKSLPYPYHDPKTVYFRDASYGRYTGSGWEAPELYYSDRKSPLSYVGDAVYDQKNYIYLEMAICEDCPRLAPYYSYAIYEGNDCYLTDPGGVTYGTFVQTDLTYSELKDKRVISSYVEHELEYRKHVYQYYLQIPESTKTALLEWAAQHGIYADSDTLVEDIQNAITNAAAYNPNGQDYPLGMDVAVYFLTEAKEGICQHFATAATLMYRAFGIPARYTVGFVDTVSYGETTALTSEDAHAWAEIYVDGLGWVAMEVTPSDTTTNQKTELCLQAYNATKYYDGQAFDSYELEQYTIAQGALQEGHRLVVSFQSEKEAVYPGEYENRITDCVVYDAQGRDVTDQYSIYFLRGRLQILQRKITIVTGSVSKQYDGKPLTCSQYWIAQGSLAPGDTLTLEMEASLTEPGWVENRLTDCRIWRGTSDVTQCYEIEYVLGRLEVTDLESVKP